MQRTSGTLKNIKVEKYNIYGNAIHIHSSDKALLSIIRKYWNPFYRKSLSLKPKAIFYIREYNAINRIIKRQYFYNDNFLLMLDSCKCITYNLYNMPWQVYFQYSNISDINVLYFYLFEPLFFNILKRLNLFYLHCAAITKNGYGAIIPGEPESGKSTTTLSLLKAGFKVLSDDELFLQKKGMSVYALGFDKDIFITKKTISFFPEFKFLQKTPYYKKGRQLKKRIEIKKYIPVQQHQKLKSI